ncbi:MAG: DUF3667 domain-containing protein [Sphingomicrobium sp.]
MGNFEALGDAVAGSVVARAVEPAAGEPGAGHTHETACLNCGAELAGPFCSSCGQHAHVHRTLSAFFHDFAHGVLHFEGKIWRTLPLLAWRPGDLTRRYIAGQRASFVSPIALFLFSVFLMFAVIGLTGNINPDFGNPGGDLATQQQTVENTIAHLEKKRADLAAQKLPAKALDESLRDSKQELELIKMMRTRGVTSAVIGNGSDAIDTHVPFLKEAFLKAKENPSLLIYKLKTNSYKWSWAIIPLSAPFVWLLFPFSRRFRFYDHVVFVTYSLCFMLLLVAAGTGIAAAGFSAIAPFLLLIPPVHMYRQLRGAYGVGRFGALWRTALLTLFAIVVLTAFMALIGALGLFD